MSRSQITNTPREFKTTAHILIESNGAYQLFGHLPLQQQFIMPDRLGDSWYYQAGREFPADGEPTRLCRCGSSARKPYCDNHHMKLVWNPRLTAELDNYMDHAHKIEGETLDLYDNEKFCNYARFCHPAGGAWRLNKHAVAAADRDMAIRESAMCPGGRLSTTERGDDKIYEFDFEPSVVLLEDPAIGVSSGLWVRGGVRISREDGMSYQIRNRVVLCRCGASNNKPFCDGTHAARGWMDGLDTLPDGAVLPNNE